MLRVRLMVTWGIAIVILHMYRYAILIERNEPIVCMWVLCSDS